MTSTRHTKEDSFSTISDWWWTWHVMNMHDISCNWYQRKLGTFIKLKYWFFASGALNIFLLIPTVQLILFARYSLINNIHTAIYYGYIVRVSHRIMMQLIFVVLVGVELAYSYVGCKSYIYNVYILSSSMYHVCMRSNIYG